MEKSYRSEIESIRIPEAYICPITRKIILEPVLLADGYNYEKKAIEEWLKSRTISPKTGRPLPHTKIVEENGLKSNIQKFVGGNSQAFEQECLRAIQVGDIPTILHYGQFGFNIHNMEDANGWSWIHHAVHRGNTTEISKCVEMGADINANHASHHLKLGVSASERKIKELQEQVSSKEEKINRLRSNPYLYAPSSSLGRLSKDSLEEELKELEQENTYLRTVRLYEDFTSFDRYQRSIHYNPSYPHIYSYKGTSGAEHEKHKENYAQAQKKLRANTQRIAEINKQLAECKASQEQAQREISELTSQLQELNSRIAAEERNRARLLAITTGRITALHLAALKNNDKLVKLLLPLGRSLLEAKDSDGATPLVWAIYQDNIEAIQFLVAHGADCDFTDNSSNNLLHVAVRFAALATIECLLVFCRSHLFHARNSEGFTPVQLAEKSGRPDIAHLLQKEAEQGSESKSEREEEYNINDVSFGRRSSLGSAHLSSSQFFTARGLPPLHASPSSPSPLIAKEKIPPAISSMSLAAAEQNIEKSVTISSPSPYSSVVKKEDKFNNSTSSFEVQHNQIAFQKVIGRGSYGTVHQALYQGKTVAVKVLTDQEASQKSIHEFRVEITLMRTLNSPYVVKVLGACLEYPHHSMILEYLPRGTLYALLSKEQSPEWDRGWHLRYQIALDIAQGLEYLHQNDIVHGDFKSPNILLEDNYRAKISDFGLAKIKQSTTSSTVIGGGAGGSIRWMAPELFEEEAKSTKYSDIFSFSTVLWELGARKTPFERTQQFAVPHLVMTGKREVITTDTPPGMASLIRFGWSQNPQERLRSHQAVAMLSEEHAKLYSVTKK